MHMNFDEKVPNLSIMYMFAYFAKYALLGVKSVTYLGAMTFSESQ